MLMQGVIFMIVGMTMVFLFLSVMVVIINFTAFIVKFFSSEEEILPQQQGAEDNEIAVAIAACKKYMSI